MEQEKIAFILRGLYTALYEHGDIILNISTYFPDFNKYGVSSVGQFRKNFGQHLIVTVFRGI